MNRTVNMTIGNPTKLILHLAVPLMLTNLGQQLYGIVDAIIVGKGIGVNAFASLGAYLMNLYRYSVQALGNPHPSLISGFFELGARVFVALVFPIFMGQRGLFFMDGAAWWAAGIYLIICFFIELRKIQSA